MSVGSSHVMRALFADASATMFRGGSGTMEAAGTGVVAGGDEVAFLRVVVVGSAAIFRV